MPKKALIDTNSSKSHIVPPLPVIKPIPHDELVNFGQKTLMGQDRQRWYKGCFGCLKKSPMKSQHGHKSLTVCKIGKIRPLLLFQLLILHTRCHFRVILSMFSCLKSKPKKYCKKLPKSAKKRRIYPRK